MMINQTSAAPVQAVEVKSATVLPFRNASSSGTEARAEGLDMKKTTNQAVEENQREAEVQKALEKKVEKENEKEELTQEMLDELSKDFEILHRVGLNFSKHEDTGRIMIKVINKDTDELIREIPSEKVLDMAAKLDEMIGVLFETKA